MKVRPIHNSVYSTYNPKGISYFTQLRIGLSKLNYHEFKHNFADTVSPVCPANGGIEDTEHFLLLCLSFNKYRRSLHAAVNEVSKVDGNIVGPNNNLFQILLYGDKNLSEEAKKQILELTIKYVLE